MEILVQRFRRTHVDTISNVFIDGTWECFGLEDEYRKVKVKGETRIPAGRYKVIPRRAGSMHQSYGRKFDFHDGMLWLQNVSNFQWIYFHIGNKHQHTEGCILVGRNIKTNPGMASFMQNSTMAYVDFYKKAIKAIQNGGDVWVEVKDE